MFVLSFFNRQSVLSVSENFVGYHEDVCSSVILYTWEANANADITDYHSELAGKVGRFQFFINRKFKLNSPKHVFLLKNTGFGYIRVCKIKT
jgi:hypothetical protein